MTRGSEPLISREAAFGQLQQALTQANQGHGRLVLVSGDAGIGKSALVSALAREAEANGAVVVLGRAWEFGEAPPYFPFRGMFASLALDPEQFPSDASLFVVWELVLAALAKLTATRTVVCVFDDIHAADLATLDLLALLAQPVRLLRALLVVTARLNDPRTDARAAQRLTRMARDGDDLCLEPFDERAVRTLAERTLGRRLSDGALRELMLRSRGNPLFVLECARALKNSAGRNTAELPFTIRNVVLERVHLLPAGTQSALAALAILGRDASAASVGRLRNQLPAKAIDDLEPARRAGILEETAPGLFAFTHILVRDAVEESLEPSERARLHGLARRALEAQPKSPEMLIERARHALSALDDDVSSVELGIEAAKLLETQGAYDRAHAMYRRIEEARRTGALPAATSLERLDQARVALAAGRFSEGRAICVELATIAEERADLALLAHAALVLGTDLRPGIVDATLVRMLERARALGAGAGQPLEARVLARLAAALQPASDPQLPVALAREAVALGERVCDEYALMEVLLLAGAAMVDYASTAECIALNRRLAALAERHDDAGSAARAHARLAISYLDRGDFAAWDEAVTRSIELSQRLDAPRLRWRPLLLESMRALALGDLATSDRCIRETEQLAAVIDDPALSLSLAAHVGAAARLLHRDTGMSEMLDGLNQIPEGVAGQELISRFIRVGTFARLEDVPRVHAELAHFGASARALEEGLFLNLFAEAAAFVGAAGECERLRSVLRAQVSTQITGGHVQMTYEGPLSRPLGLIESALGHFTAAERLLREALATVSEQGFAPWIAQLHYDLGTSFERAGRRADACASFRRARELAGALPMPGLVERADKHLVQLGDNAERDPLRSGESPRVSLHIERQGELWLLSFKGRSLRLKDSRGLQLLSRLVEHAGQEMHVLTLSSDEPGSSLQDPGFGDSLDARAKREYREGVAHLTHELHQAENDNDGARVERLRRELEAIRSELSKALGLGGKARGGGSPSERARVNVQRRLKDAIARISELDRECGQYLERSVRTGNYCVFLG